MQWKRTCENWTIFVQWISKGQSSSFMSWEEGNFSRKNNVENLGPEIKKNSQRCFGHLTEKLNLERVCFVTLGATCNGGITDYKKRIMPVILEPHFGAQKDV